MASISGSTSRRAALARLSAAAVPATDAAGTVQRGFSLLEVLIAILVLSVGVLGLAGLQMVGLQESQASQQRSLAIQLVYDIADRMRANRNGVAAGGYQLAPGAGPAAATVDCLVSPCTAAQLASHDLALWYQRLQAQLPSASASIVCTDGCAIGRRLTVAVQWDQTRQGVPGQSCSATTPTALGCVAVNLAP